MIKMFKLNPFILVGLLSNLFIAASMPSPIQAPLGTPPQIPLSAATQKPLNPEIPLRVLPLGNSITWGYGSASGNGYREPLLSLLPNSLTYIGSEHSGNMSNNENEGHPGAIIYQIAMYADQSLRLRPNVILLMAGTNDIMGNFGVEEAPSRLSVLIDRCVTACPDAVILVAQLTPMLARDAQHRADVFNAAIPMVVNEKVEQGKKVLAINMEQYVGLDGLMDGLHPSDKGYNGMAKAWYDGINKAAGKGWIERPMKVDDFDEIDEIKEL